MLTGEVKKRLIDILTLMVERHQTARALVTDEVSLVFCTKWHPRLLILPLSDMRNDDLVLFIDASCIPSGAWHRVQLTLFLNASCSDGGCLHVCSSNAFHVFVDRTFGNITSVHGWTHRVLEASVECPSPQGFAFAFINTCNSQVSTCKARWDFVKKKREVGRKYDVPSQANNKF